MCGYICPWCGISVIRTFAIFEWKLSFFVLDHNGWLSLACFLLYNLLRHIVTDPYRKKIITRHQNNWLNNILLKISNNFLLYFYNVLIYYSAFFSLIGESWGLHCTEIWVIIIAWVINNMWGIRSVLPPLAKVVSLSSATVRPRILIEFLSSGRVSRLSCKKFHKISRIVMNLWLV